MFSEFSVKRIGNQWEVHIVNADKIKHTTMSNNECATYLDLATEIVQDLARADDKAIRAEMK